MGRSNFFTGFVCESTETRHMFSVFGDLFIPQENSLHFSEEEELKVKRYYFMLKMLKPNASQLKITQTFDIYVCVLKTRPLLTPCRTET